jgi:putative selenate reductase FAD-binding subunit
MIKYLLQPNSIADALALKQQHSATSTWFAGGSKLNATPTKTDKTVAISIDKLALDKIEMKNGMLHIGAMCRIQSIIDNALTPSALQIACGFIYSLHLRNQSTLGGEIAAFQLEPVLLPTLFALNAIVVLADNSEVSVEDYVNDDKRELIIKVIIPNPNLACASCNLTRSAAGLAVITAAVSIDPSGNQVIALHGASPLHHGYSVPIRLRDVEGQHLQEELLEQAVADAINPVDDLCGSVAYKRYITGVIITDLVAECQQFAQEL